LHETEDTPLGNLAHRRERGRRTVAESGVTTLPVIEHFDPFENILSCLIAREIATAMDEFDFQCVQEAFHDRIATGDTHRLTRTNDHFRAWRKRGNGIRERGRLADSASICSRRIL